MVGQLNTTSKAVDILVSDLLLKHSVLPMTPNLSYLILRVQSFLILISHGSEKLKRIPQSDHSKNLIN